MNWQQLFEDYNIHYVTRGPNTRKGELSIKCPFCADEDPSEHMGVALTHEAWGCHRDSAHRGKGPVRLIKALLGVSTNQAKLALAQYDAADPETLDQAIAALTGEAKPMEPEPEKLVMPADFKRINKHGAGKRFWGYLYDRGFDSPGHLAQWYDLRYCTTGRWKDRIIIPVYSNKELIGWTGRAIMKSHHAPRYLSTSDAIKTVVYNEYRLQNGGKTLFICEGPFDALKLDFYLFQSHKATCTFGVNVTPAQVGKLRAYSRRFEVTCILFDREAEAQAMQLQDMIPRSHVGALPYGVKDPGDLTQAQVRSLTCLARL